MCYIKMFIANKKKQDKKTNFEAQVKTIFDNSLEAIFDDVEYVKAYFNEFLGYSENKYKDLLSNNINLEDFLCNHIEEIGAIDKSNNKYFYYKELFLNNFISSKIS